jgi:DNA-binding NarL/FixJ family response regulator
MSQIVIVAPPKVEMARLKARLTAAGHEVGQFTASDGVIVALAQSQPDLILISDEKPVADVPKLCAMLHGVAALRQIPILLLTDFSDEKDGYALASTVGANGAISRSWPVDRMVTWVSDVLLQKAVLLPNNEAQRLATLWSYQVLDTQQELIFDDLARVASIVCHTPIALVSLIDGQRQWFKARIGIDVAETPRQHAFCAHAIHGQEILEVIDTTRDIRFAENPFVVGEPRVRFYAGAPLLMSDGNAAGTLCVIDSTPRQLTTEQRMVLTKLGRVVSQLLELRRRI